MRRCVLSRVWLFGAPWTVACQSSLSVGFSRQEYWSRLPFPPSGDLPNQGSNPCLLHLLHWQVGSLPLAPPGNHLYFNKEKRLSSTNHLYSILASWGLESWCYTPKKIFSFFSFLFLQRQNSISRHATPSWLFHISLVIVAPDTVSQ